jgi:hypothetical protein|nr:HNH endonuclease [Moraxella osloensis]
MGISEKSMKILWASAAGRCSFEGCNIELVQQPECNIDRHLIGEMAHIKGDKAGSLRYDPTQDDKERHGYENLILLCPTHHTMIDKKENENYYTVDLLKQMKINHENMISKKLEKIEFESLNELKCEIAKYLLENKSYWEQYSFQSEKAKKQPYNDTVFQKWIEVRLTKIVPNNRLIVRLLEDNKELFSANDYSIVQQFLIHSESYEQWVSGEYDYSIVVRFPKSFEELVNN